MATYNVSVKKVGDTGWTLFKPVRGKHKSIAQAKLLARPQAGITARVTDRLNGDVLFESDPPHLEHVCTVGHFDDPALTFDAHRCDGCGITWDLVDPDNYQGGATPCTMAVLPW